MNFLNLLGAVTSNGPFKTVIEENSNWTGIEWVRNIAIFLDNMILPVTIIVSIIGAVWIIWLGVQLAKAEEAGKQKEAKGKLINVVIAMVSVIILIWILTWFSASASTIFNGSTIPTT
ncbi:MAG: hypothetical protein EOM55_02155 [Clostridia bacterium]|nr:hypothetical protein [Clostridia bacterium]